MVINDSLPGRINARQARALRESHCLHVRGSDTLSSRKMLGTSRRNSTKIIFALTLLGVFLVEPALPALSPGTESDLPACCRKGGKHHCAMRKPAPSAGPTFAESGNPCPLFPKSGPARNPVSSLMPSPAQFCSAPVPTYTTPLAQTEALYRIAYNRSRQKRGPPQES